MWILILYIYAGTFASGDSVTLNNISGFTTEANCMSAGAKTEKLVSFSTKEIKYLCVKTY